MQLLPKPKSIHAIFEDWNTARQYDLKASNYVQGFIQWRGWGGASLQSVKAPPPPPPPPPPTAIDKAKLKGDMVGVLGNNYKQ